MGSLLDSALGGWFQASVVDTRTGKIVEGTGGGKVGPSFSYFANKPDQADFVGVLTRCLLVLGRTTRNMMIRQADTSRVGLVFWITIL